MTDQPTHIVLIEDQNGIEMRRLGPMHLGRAHQVKSKFENNPLLLLRGLDTARIINNPNWDFELGKEIS